MVPEAGLVRASTDDGRTFTFRPSFARTASLGTPHEIVAIYAGLHGPKAAEEAPYVLACYCDPEGQDELPELIGCRVGDHWQPGAMPLSEQIIIARHLMRHGIVGKARPGNEKGPATGQYSPAFDVSEYISAARVHLGLSSADAEELSMTEFQTMLAMKFPEQQRSTDLPSREEYRAARAAYTKHREAKRG